MRSSMHPLHRGSAKRGKLRASVVIAITASAALVFGGVAYADNISNSLDSTVDAVAESMPLTLGGANGSTTLYVVPTNGDGKNGCNLTGSTTLVVAVASSNTAVATVSPTSVTFSACGDTPTLTVTPVAQGSATVSLSQTSNSTAGTFDLAPATFTVNVTPPPNTAPTVQIAGVTGGASYNKGSVPAATCEVSDAEDGSSSFVATLSAVTGPYSSDGIGEQTASCSYTDQGGLTASASVTYAIVDPTAPAISYTLTPATPDGLNGWYKTDVTLSWTVSEPESPNSLQKTGCEDQAIKADQAATDYTCSATSAGGSASEQKVTVKRDATAPSVTAGAPQGTVGKSGWYTSDVTVTFTGTDATSGPATQTKDASTATEGLNVELKSPEFTDNAGNTAASGADTENFNIDKTVPTDIAFAGVTDYYFGEPQTDPTCTAADAVSGLASCVVTGGGTAVGQHTWTATATDNAGNTATATAGYEVKAWTTKGFYAPVDMGGVWNTVKNGSTVPLKFELFAGVNELTNTSAVSTFTVQKAACDATAPTDAVEFVTTGGTSLRYDATAGQFVQNWQTPKTPGACYVTTMTAQDGSRLSANFKLK